MCVQKSIQQLWNEYYETDAHVFNFRSYRTSGAEQRWKSIQFLFVSFPWKPNKKIE